MDRKPVSGVCFESSEGWPDNALIETDWLLPEEERVSGTPEAENPSIKPDWSKPRIPKDWGSPKRRDGSKNT